MASRKRRKGNSEDDAGSTSVRLNEAFERLEKQRLEADESEAEPEEAQAEPESADAGDAVEPEPPEPQSTVARAAARSEPPPKASGSPLGALGLLIALIALGIASFAAFMVWTSDDSTSRSPAVTSADLDAVASRLEQLERRSSRPAEAEPGLSPEVQDALDRLTSLQRQVQQNLDDVSNLRGRLDEVTSRLASRDLVTAQDLDELRARITETLAGLRSEMGTTPQDWLLAEVEYLLRLGAQRVEMQSDAQGALVMFETADEILRTAEGVAAFGLREAIANDIAELRAVSTIDVEGIYVRLGSLKAQVDGLRQAKSEFEPTPVAEQMPSADATVTDRVLIFADNMVARLASLLDYRRDEERIRPALPPREEYYLRQNLLIKLQMAQLALLRGNQEVFDQSVGEAQEWLSHFDPEHAVTMTLRTTLEQLEGANVQQSMPDVSESVRAARQMLNRFQGESERNLVQ